MHEKESDLKVSGIDYILEHQEEAVFLAIRAFSGMPFQNMTKLLFLNHSAAIIVRDCGFINF